MNIGNLYIGLLSLTEYRISGFSKQIKFQGTRCLFFHAQVPCVLPYEL